MHISWKTVQNSQEILKIVEYKYKYTRNFGNRKK
jgi:hypothetical protein